MVEVVGEQVDGHVGDQFGDLAVTEPRRADLRQVVVVHPAAFGDQAARKDQPGAGSGIGRLAPPAVQQGLLAEAA